MADTLSLTAAASSSQGVPSDMMTGNFNRDSIFSSDSFNPFSLLNNMQIGSTSITNADWSVLQTVAMNLVGDNSSQEQQSYSNILKQYTSSRFLACFSYSLYWTGLVVNNAMQQIRFRIEKDFEKRSKPTLE